MRPAIPLPSTTAWPKGLFSFIASTPVADGYTWSGRNALASARLGVCPEERQPYWEPGAEGRA